MEVPILDELESSLVISRVNRGIELGPVEWIYSAALDEFDRVTDFRISNPNVTRSRVKSASGGVVAHSPLPHHPACGSVPGGSVRLSPDGPEVRFVFRHKGFAARQVSVFGFTVF
jgi:hypothetical protein